MLQLFKFESKDVRCYGTWNNPIWIAQEICDCLELSNNRQALARLDEDEKDVISIDTPGGVQEVLAVNEPGLYSLVLGCRKPIAKRFKRWVTHDVIPSIRKTGSYVAESRKVLPPREIAELADIVLVNSGIDPMLIAGFKANEISKAHPEYKELMEAAKKLLPLPVEQELVTVTELARKYVEKTGSQLTKNNTDRGNAIAFNQLLIELGLQISNPNGNPSYLPTKTGEPFSKVVLQEGKGSNKTCQQLRWYPSLIDQIS